MTRAPRPGSPDPAPHASTTESGGPAPTRSGPAWPDDPADQPSVGYDWRDTLRNASDLALLGIVTTVATLPVVTAGAAVATASTAVHHWIETGGWPGVRPALHTFRRAILAGAGATATGAFAALLLTVNLLALSSGAIPGWKPLLVITAVLAAATLGFAGLTVVQLGRQTGQGWRLAARRAGALALARPAALLGAGGVLVLTGVLCVLVLPLLTPILAGYAIFALHATTRRIAPTTD